MIIQKSSESVSRPVRSPSLRSASRVDHWLAVLFVCTALLRIVSAYRLTQTFDEPFHLACGMQLLQNRIYTIELQHPPLARVAVAIGPYLAGLRMSATGDAAALGNGILSSGGRYWRNLALARLGTLPFFVGACAVVWFWSQRISGSRAALCSVFLFTQIPPVLAHAALATTDFASAATLIFALYCFDCWLRCPTLSRIVMLGAATGLTLATKFSALLFLPGCAAILICFYLLTHTVSLGTFARWSLLRQVIVGAAVAYLVISAGYLFTLAPIHGGPDAAAVQRQGIHSIRDAANAMLVKPVPAGQVPRSIKDLLHHNRGGHTASLLGKWSRHGWWYFFPVLFVFKTPLAFLALSVIGAAFLVRSGVNGDRSMNVVPILFATVILASAMFSGINIGLRHVLAIYPLLSIAAGHAVVELWRRAGGTLVFRGLAVGLVGWLAGSSAFNHPDYLAYFNEFAGRSPERIEVESDLDWGQDLDRLSKWLHARGVTEVGLSYFGTAELSQAGLPKHFELPPNREVDGWIAISAHYRALPGPFVVTHPAGQADYYSLPGNFDRLKPADGPFAWLAGYQPVARIGRSIFVYYIPAARERANTW
jgi:hypothetical protein